MQRKIEQSKLQTSMVTPQVADYAKDRQISFAQPWLHITLAVNMIFLFINYKNPVFPIECNFVTIFISFCFYGIYSSKFKKYINYFLYFFYLIWISFYAIIAHYQTGMIVYFIVLFSLSVTLFDTLKTRRKMTALAVLAFISVILIKPHVASILNYIDPWRSLVHFIICSVAILFAIYKYAINEENELRNKDGLINQIKEKNNELERFAYITSHDLKQPVRNIVSFSGLLERSIKGENDQAKNLEYLSYIKSSSDSLENLIDDILRLSKIGTQDFNNEVVDLENLLNKVLSSLSLYIEENNASITFDRLPQMLGNKIYMSLVLQNLIENGIKYNKSESPTVYIGYSDKGINHQISVQDNGLGIDKKYFDLIFMPFKRLHDNSEFKGSGLGLSICKRILDLMGGSIDVESDAGSGTKFNLLIPKSKET